MGEKSNLKVVPVVEGEKALEQPKENKLTKSQEKKLAKEREKQIKAQAEEQAKQMEKQVVGMGKAVKNAICNKCVHCANPNKTFDRFAVTSSKGKELYCPMNFCKLAGLSLVDVQSCEGFVEIKPENGKQIRSLGKLVKIV